MTLCPCVSTDFVCVFCESKALYASALSLSMHMLAKKCPYFSEGGCSVLMTLGVTLDEKCTV